MDQNLKALLIDVSSGFYKIERFPLGEFFGPVDLGLFLSGKYNSLNIGSGVFSGSIFPGSNRLFFNGISPCWHSFFISSMGGAGLVFDNLGINMLSIINRAPTPSLLYLNRIHGEEVELKIIPLDINKIWQKNRMGVYAMMDHALEMLGEKYKTEPRILAVGPASSATDFGAIASAPVKKDTISPVDTWAGRGGFGSKMLREHGIAAVIYGGTYIDEDFRDRNVADKWFEDKYNKKLAAKDFEATKKYRFDPDFETGGTFGVNYKKISGSLLAFNYSSIYMSEEERLEIYNKFIIKHYLSQFNEETIKPKKMKTCGEPCAALCKKMNGEFKKDYEPYQALGPLCGVFDQRAAEKIVHHADILGFDAISAGGVVSWLMECASQGILSLNETGIKSKPNFELKNFSLETDSMHNADIGIDILNSIISGNGIINLEQGVRKFARDLGGEKGQKMLDLLVFTANARRGWMAPNQYWTPGVLSPMPIMGKYYNHYGSEFHPPRELGKISAERLIQELILDNAGICRFHRNWAEDIIPDIIGSIFGKKELFLEKINLTAQRINSRNAGVFWESRRNIDFISAYLIRKHDIEGDNSQELTGWIDRFKKNKEEAALDFWFEMRKGIDETLRDSL